MNVIVKLVTPSIQSHFVDCSNVNIFPPPMMHRNANGFVARILAAISLFSIFSNSRKPTDFFISSTISQLDSQTDVITGSNPTQTIIRANAKPTNIKQIVKDRPPWNPIIAIAKYAAIAIEAVKNDTESAGSNTDEMVLR